MGATLPFLVRYLQTTKISQADPKEVGDREYFSPEQEPLEILGDKQSLLQILAGFPLITASQPRTEYYLLRHHFSQAPTLTSEALDSFIKLLKGN